MAVAPPCFLFGAMGGTVKIVELSAHPLRYLRLFAVVTEPMYRDKGVKSPTLARCWVCASLACGLGAYVTLAIPVPGHLLPEYP